MKPTSIIFLIVSIVLVIGGFATAGVAKQLAAAEGIELGEGISDDGENVVYTYEYDADNIGKISINVKEATVNVIGGAAKPYIELVNFPEGMYDFSSSNRVITLNDSAEFTSLSGLASLAMNFKGLRSFVNYYNMMELERTVNIYLCEDYPVNVIDVTAMGGSVNIKDNATSTDYNIDIAVGELNMDNIHTSSSVSVEVETGDINLNGCEIEQMSAKLGVGSIKMNAHIYRLDASISTGDFNYGYYGSLQFTNYKLFTNVGTITVDGEAFGGYKESSELATQNIISVSVGVGDIVIDSDTQR